MNELAQYRSHKIVSAGEIVEPIDTAAPGITVPVVLVDAGGQKFTRETMRKVFARGYPSIGDYLVVYPDGYVSWSPRIAFEDGYSRVIGNSK